MQRIVGHLDMDAFFASVEEREKPYLRGLPVIIGSDPQEGAGRGVVSTANYEARKLGIHSAMPIKRAWSACKQNVEKSGKNCVFITSGFRKYTKASEEVFALIRSFVKTLEQTSVDEAYMDLSFCNSYKDAGAFAKKLKKEIVRQTGLSCSVGIGPSKMIAKIASDYKKPDGLTVVTAASVEKFIKKLPVSNIPGIGKKAQLKLRKCNISTIEDAQKYSWREFYEMFGKSGFTIWERCRGIDERSVNSEGSARKSIGKHHTFDVDVSDMKDVMPVVKDQTKIILKSLKKHGFSQFRTVAVVIRFSDFVNVTRSITLDEPIHSERDLELKATKLLLPFFEKTQNPQNKSIRMVGLRIEKMS